MQLCIDGILVFSTYVEVIPIKAYTVAFQPCILHVCGGDPIFFGRVPNMQNVFSTYVEVIPIQDFYAEACKSILHVCGGDPQ